MGSAYGGMAARILLQPLEENARLLWSRLAFEPVNPSKQTEHEPRDPLEQSYTALVKLVLLVGLVFGCIAVNYTHLLLSILAGRKWARNEQASTVLAAFCVYTAFLAWNGMTEAFVYGVTTSQKDIGRLGLAHTVTGIVFALSAPMLVSRYGTVGLVAANCVAMSFRSLYSVYFAAKYFHERRKSIGGRVATLGVTARRLLWNMLPRPVLLASFVASWIATRYSWQRVQAQHHDMTVSFYEEYDIRKMHWLLLSIRHVAVGVSCVLGIASVLYMVEVEFRRSLVSLIRRRRAKQD